MPDERWLPLPCFGGIFKDAYEISDQGRARNSQTGHILKPGLANGYYMILPSMHGVRRKVYIHRAVAEAFIGPCPEGQEVRHGPNGKLDNRATELRYGTSSENNYDIVEHGKHFWAN